MSISLDEAKQMVNEDNLNHLRNNVQVIPTVNMDAKANCDIIMQALCRAVSDNVIHARSLNQRLVKLLNSRTNTLSETKLFDVLNVIHSNQPDIALVISLKTGDMLETVHEWIIYDDESSFSDIFAYIINEYDVTPQQIRSTMTKTLKPTIVNNVAQLVAKYRYLDTVERSEIRVSISTITRIVNMLGYLLFAEFKEIKR